VSLETTAGAPLHPQMIERDLRRWWTSGWVEDVRVESVQTRAGMEIVFHVVEKRAYYVRNVVVTGAPSSKAVVRPGTRLDGLAAHRTAAELRKNLKQEGYREARVDFTIVPAGPFKVDLHLAATPGPKHVINRVNLTGDLRFDAAEIRDVLQAAKPRTILPMLWKNRPALTAEALAADASRIRSLYASRGYFNAAVRPSSEQRGDGLATVSFEITAGARTVLRDLRSTGAIGQTPGLPDDGTLPTRKLCQCLSAARRKAESDGRLDFQASLHVTSDGSDKGVGVTVDSQTGGQYRVGRIEFSGNRSYSDSTLRRLMRLDEGELFDWGKLYASLSRIDRLGFFEPMSDRSLTVIRHPESRIADVSIALVQRSGGRWSLSGPAGPFRLGGPLHASIASRLPPWGRGVLEASTYYLTFNLAGMPGALKTLAGGRGRTFFPYVSLARPYLPGQEWFSGFNLSPQFAWKSMAIDYGMTQTHHRVRALAAPRASTDARPILVPVRLNDAEQPVTMLICEPPKPRLPWLRAAGAFALDWFLGGR
jgi:outer membrane protein insertion porin family